MQTNLFRGGKRPGSGRKRIHSKGVAHRRREKITKHKPAHINFKFKTQIRNKDCLRLLKRAIMNGRRHGIRVTHFSLLSNHIHLIVEAETNDILTKGMRSITVTFAKGLNKGRVQLERYHLHILRYPRETKNAVMYVLFNRQKHEKGTYSKIDEYTSVLSMKDGIKLIKEYIGNKRLTLKIEKGEPWIPDLPKSYLLLTL